MSLITVGDLDARRIIYQDVVQAETAIDDVSAEARVLVAPLLDDVEAPDTPQAVKFVIADVIRRTLSNPNGYSQESLGDYSYSAGQFAASGGFSRKEKKRLFRAVGKPSITSLSMSGDLPVQPSEGVTVGDDGLTL